MYYLVKNCQTVCSESFANWLCKAFYTTGRISLTVSIFKHIIQNSFSLQNISQSENLFDFIIHQLHIKDNKPQIQKNLMIILYRITGTDKGVKIMSSEEYWNALLQYFLQNDDRCRMTKIKAFTILNRSIPKRNLPREPDYYSINFSDNVLKELQNANCFENPLNDDIDESEDDEENFDSDSYDSRNFDDEIESENMQLNIERNKPELPKHKLEPFFSELQPSDDYAYKPTKTNNLEIFKKLEAFLNENATSNSSPSTVYNYLFSQTQKHSFTKSIAHPDLMLVDADPSDNNQTICVSTSKQLTKTLAGKLCRLKFEPPRVYPTVYFVEQDNEENGFSSVETISIIDEHRLKFSSTFEGGNLRYAERVSQYEYNLMVTGDYKTENFSQWFYFSVTNMEAGKPYSFNIINFKRINSQFNHGMQPVMFSVKDFLRKRYGWKRTGKNIIYYGNNFRSKTNTKQYRTLSFCITFSNSKDTCFIAYHYPYTYTRLLTNIYLNYQKLAEDSIYVRVDKLCNTIKSNEVPLITITGKSSTKELQKRPIVFITGRVHPGESNSSWIIQGLLDFLLNEHDEKAAQARNSYIFKIIPMLNPEGVILGQSRNGITGEDLNRCYKNPNPILHPEIYYLKSIVGYAVKILEHPIATFIDIHGHSRKKFFFFYGCDPKKSWNSADRKQLDFSDICTLLPTYINNNNLNKSFCRYDFNSEKESTCRVMMWREFGIKCSYTLESSFCSGENKKKITTETLQQIGVSLVTALAFIAQQKIWQKKKVFDE
ncbi:cytosolic carboxypeptidase 1-like [Agrilus planipennis]|uniref:Cytosolic carboxypeptidase 1-like n=1 Tax=Agrilus planipennis TaxID=224129 RepID=A0A7F5R8P7_AGRPL|nr:cytosolic carboxypeptidase 1-like [Agrilus planipennis]